jgi:hypothetical protein
VEVSPAIELGLLFVLVVHDSTVGLPKYDQRRSNDMNNWNKLLALLDLTLGFANRTKSKVMKRGQGYDNKTHEHVIWLEYRVSVRNDVPLGESKPEMNRLRQAAADLAAARVFEQ